MTINFAPGEDNVYADSFSPSVLLFWLKSEMTVSSTRMRVALPNTILGIVPVGGNKKDQGLKNIAEISVNVRMSLKRLFVGLGLLMFGFDSPVLLVPAIVILASVFRATLHVMNNGGGVTETDVSIFEKDKLQRFADEVNQRLFADQELLRHQEVIAVQQENLHAQLINAQMAQLNQERQIEATLSINNQPEELPEGTPSGTA